MATRTENAQAFAKNHPYVAFGVLLVPITYAVTGDIMTAVFAGGIVAFGPAIGEGLRESDLGDDTEDNESGGGDDE